MPPVNTPAVASPTARSPTLGAAVPEHAEPSPSLAALSYLNSPVPDLAATLHASIDDDAEEENVNFLRESLDSLDQPSQPTLRTRIPAERENRANRQTETAVPPFADLRSLLRSTRARNEENREGERRHAGRESGEDYNRQERLQRVLARLNRLHEPAASSTSAYTNRTPSPHRQSLYDWAPAYNEENGTNDTELDSILNDLRRQQPEAHPNILRVVGQSQLDGARQRQREGSGTPAPADSSSSNYPHLTARQREDRLRDWWNLSGRAAAQEARGTPNATDRMLRYVMDRERSGLSEEEERARDQGWFRPGQDRQNDDQHRSSSNRDDWLLPPPASELRQRDRQERVDAFRRGYLAENMPPRLPRISTPPGQPATENASPTSSSFAENALNYLNELRDCEKYEDALSIAIDNGLATKEFFADKHDDFIMDVLEIEPLAETSWLQPGSIFEGHQYATNRVANIPRQAAPVSSHIEQINPNFSNPASAPTMGFDHPPGSTRVAAFDATRPWLSHQFTPPTSNGKPPETQHDDWRVRVVVHAIDRSNMTFQGTMEAYDVPQHPSPNRSYSPNLTSDQAKSRANAPITTYVDGQIIDLRNHSLLTPSSPDPSPQDADRHTLHNSHTIPLPSQATFPSASPAVDVSNWRKLPPFTRLRPDEFARTILSRARMAEISEDCIFMRWKERCFVHGKDDPCTEPDRHGDQDRGHGLTISGFYYVSLRRGDGRLEGLYYDPSSTPYQHLRLGGLSCGWPAYELR